MQPLEWWPYSELEDAYRLGFTAFWYGFAILAAYH